MIGADELRQPDRRLEGAAHLLQQPGFALAQAVDLLVGLEQLMRQHRLSDEGLEQVVGARLQAGLQQPAERHADQQRGGELRALPQRRPPGRPPPLAHDVEQMLGHRLVEDRGRHLAQVLLLRAVGGDGAGQTRIGPNRGVHLHAAHRLQATVEVAAQIFVADARRQVAVHQISLAILSTLVAASSAWIAG